MVIFGGGCTGKICIVHYSHIQYQGYLNLLDGKKKSMEKRGLKKRKNNILSCLAASLMGLFSLAVSI